MIRCQRRLSQASFEPINLSAGLERQGTIRSGKGLTVVREDFLPGGALYKAADSR
jgi:hypothetical protein